MEYCTSISGVKFRWTTLYCRYHPLTRFALRMTTFTILRYTEGEMPEIKREKSRVDDILNKPVVVGSSSPSTPSSSSSPKRPNAQRNPTSALTSPVERAARCVSAAAASGGGGGGNSCEMDSAANSSSSDYFEAAAAARQCPSSAAAAHLPPT